jgi:TolB protein
MRRRVFLGMLCTAALQRTAARAAEGAVMLDGEQQRLADSDGTDSRANFAVDGSSLLFESRRTGKAQIWTMRPDGGGARQLLKSDGNDHGRVAPSPDGRRLCFSSDREGQNALYVLDIASGGVTAISDQASWSFGPSWSKRDEIAYFSAKGGNKLNIRTVRPDGSGDRQITDRPGESRQPWWSPDGNMLAFSSDGGSGEFQIWLAEADGSKARSITVSGNWQQPFWSPDGTKLAVSTKLEDLHFRIIVMNSDGSEPQEIAQPAAADNVHPVWSPDGRSIVFTSGGPDAGTLHRFRFT